MFSKKHKPTTVASKPSIYTTDTGGIGIDARELFTTDAGRAAIKHLLESEPPATGNASASENADERQDELLQQQRLVR